MLPLIPRDTPALGVMLADLGNPPPADIARALDVSTATVRRWLAADSAPRTALLTLFWVTRWGRSQVDAQVVNEARTAWGMVRCLEGEATGLRARIAYLEAVGRFDSANEPLYTSEVRRAVPAAFDPLAHARHRADDERGQERTADDDQSLTADFSRLR